MKKSVVTIVISALLIIKNGALCSLAQPVTDEPARNRVNSLKLPWEEVCMHTDRNKYISGEDLWFSLYNIDAGSKTLFQGSIIAYVELLNPRGKAVVQGRFRLDGGRGAGSFLLPDTIRSGTYKIRAYTNWMKNFLPENCYVQNIDIYNPSSNETYLGNAESNEIIQENDTARDQPDLRISVDTLFGRREKVILKINHVSNIPIGEGSYDLSISVAPAEATSESSWKYFSPGISKDSQIYESETEGHYLSGRVEYRQGNDTTPSNFLYMSIQGKVAEFRYADIDSTGRFVFILPPDTKSRNLVLQPDHPENNMVLEIDPSFSRVARTKNVVTYNLTKPEMNLFSRLSFNYQASKIYGLSSRKLAEINNNKDQKLRRFYGIPEMEIVLDDYVRLPSMQEVFFELLPGIILRTKKSGYEMKITNPMTGVYYNEPPLVMIDGVIINDLTVLVDLDPDRVDKIEVVKTPYLIGDMILHGIVNVITRSGNFSDVTMPDYAVIMPYRVVERPYLFVAPDYSDGNLRFGRIPDLRNTLYWNPSIKTDSSGSAEVEFWTSDCPGLYRVSIHGVSDTGKSVTSYALFRVK
jgi:hypothetical protein